MKGFARNISLKFASAFALTMTLTIAFRPTLGMAAETVRCETLFSETIPQPSLPSRMDKMKAFVYVTVGGVMTLVPMTAWAGGFSGVGGGGGVAQAKTAEDTALLRSALERRKALPEDLLSRLKIRTLEHWEMEKKGVKPFAIPKDATWETVLEMAKENIRAVSPMLLQRLNMAEEWMSFADWQEFQGMGRLHDASTKFELDSNETPIQLALRFSEGNNGPGDGPARGRLRLKVVFNKPVFDRMDPVDQAMLVLHELFYALAQATGHQNSDQIRPHVRVFFSEQLVKLRRLSENGLYPVEPIPMIRKKLIETFGDYPLFFSSADLNSRGEAKSADRHRSVFVEVLTKLRETMRSCRESGLEGPVCAEKAFRAFGEKSMQGELSDEQAFMFVAYFALEMRMNSFNAESLSDAQRSPQELAEALKVACAQIDQIEAITDESKSLFRAALRYCR